MKRNIIVGNKIYRLVQRDLMLSSGLLNAGEIVVSNAPEDDHDPDETLFHEIIHACEQELIATRKLSQVFSEEYVEEIGALLYRTLIRNGWVKMEVGWDQLEFDF